MKELKKKQIAVAVASALSAAMLGSVHAGNDDQGPKPKGTYVTGDIHNHTTCSDGSISMQKLIKKSTDTTDTPWGLDWFVQAGHGGNGNRNCTLAEDATLATPAYPLVFATNGTTLQGPNTSWQNTNPAIQPKGRVQGNCAQPGDVALAVDPGISSTRSPSTSRRSRTCPFSSDSSPWSPDTSTLRCPWSQASCRRTRTNGSCRPDPGYSPLGNATALAEWSYCFDRGDTDTSRGNTVVGGTVGNNWDCSVDRQRECRGSKLGSRGRQAGAVAR